MTIDEKIRDEKLQYKINREAAKISALGSGKLINMGEENKYLMGEEILPSVPSQIIQQSKFTYSLLGKVFK